MTAPQLAAATVVAGKYQVGACLGYAGSSATYQAIGTDGREVVLKLFDPAIRQRADIMAALEQTYAATNAMPHEVAVPLLDAGYDPATGAPFSVSERIPLPSLAQISTQRPLTPEETGTMIGALGHLLDQAHARQLFHHALKPTNVFVGFGQRSALRVTDFGAGLVRTAVPTQEGYALAAPWLAPEQVQGASPAGAAADVFTAGLLAFFALTCRSYWRACQGPLDLAGWQREVMSPRTPPSARALQLGVMLSSAFDGILGCALSLDPGQRYRSVGELAAAMEQVAGVGAGGPASQSTMAFPPGALPPGRGDYPPPPPPAGGMGMPQQQAAPTLASAYAQAQAMQGMQAMQGQQPMQEMPPVRAMLPSAQGIPGQPPIPQAPHAQGQAAYVSMQSSPSEGPLGETAAGRPIDPAILTRRPSSNRLAPILVGLIALVMLGGAGAAWILMGKRSSAERALAASSSASPSAAPTEAAADTGSAAPSAAPADTGSAAPAGTGSAAPSAEPSAAPSASADANGGPADLSANVICDPADCDEIKIDDKVIDLTKPFIVSPGKHMIVVVKAGYVTIKESVTLKDGEKLDKTYRLTLRPTGPAVQATSKPCGKFLKRCK